MQRSGPPALFASALALTALTGTVIHAQSLDEPTNLLPNGGFEQGLEGWVQPVGAALAVVDEPVHLGGAAGKVAASTPGTFALITQYGQVRVEPRAEHTLSIWVYDPDALVEDVSLEFLDAEQVRVGVPERALRTTVEAGWQLFEAGPVRAPAGAAHARVRVTAEASAAGEVFHVDSAELAAGPAPPAPTETPPATSTVTPSATPPGAPALFGSLTNGDFELPGDAPYGWRSHAGSALVTSAGGSRVGVLTSAGRATAWLHQAVSVEGGRWYRAEGLLRPVVNAELARVRVAWYASQDASGAQLSTDDSDELSGAADSFASVSTGAIRAPAEARSAQLRVMLRPASEASAVLHADDVSLVRTAPPPSAPAARSPAAAPTPEAMPTFFVALTNGDFELPGDTPYGWRAHAGAVFIASDGSSRSATLTARGRSTAWLHQSFTVEGGRWYEAGGRLRPVSNASLARIRVAWYASEDASGAQLSTDDSDELTGTADSFASVSTGAIRAPAEARSAELRVMLRPAGDAPAVLRADDLSFARTAAPPIDVTPELPLARPASTQAAPTFFASLTNGDFELPGDTPYGWRAHAGDASIASGGATRIAALTSRGAATAWLHQSCAIEGGRWYEAAGLLHAGAGVGLARLRVAWYASDDASGPQLAVVDSEVIEGASDAFIAVSSGAVRAPDEARSAQLRIMLRPAGETPSTLFVDDVSFARTAPPPAPVATPRGAASPAPEAAPSFFAALTNGDFELPGEPPYGWSAHAGDVRIANEGGSRAAALSSRGASTAWLHQSFSVEGGQWYESSGRLRPTPTASLVRIRVAWYASEDASGPQLAVADSPALEGASDPFVAVSSGAIRAPDAARSAQLRIMLRPAGEAAAVVHADDVSFTRAPAPASADAPSGAPRTGSGAASASHEATATATPVAASAATAALLEPYDARSASAILLRITELLPDPPQSGADGEYEWIEIGNVGAAAASLRGLMLVDNHGRLALPDLTLPAGGVVVVAGPRAEIGGAIALRHGAGLLNGLGNGGDRLTLATAGGAILDALSYGSDSSVDSPPLRAPSAGHSLQRRFDSAGRLIGTAVAEIPSPGRLEAYAPPDAAAAAGPGAPPAATAGAADAGAYTSPSSVESLRKQLDDAAETNRTAWIVLVAIAAVALVAAAAHRARELLRSAPPASGPATPRRSRRWRRYASAAQLHRHRRR